MVSAEEIRASVIKNGVHKLLIHDCAICREWVGYYFFSYPPHEVVFDSSCGCGRSYPRPCSWEDVAKHINMQTNEEYIKKLKEQLGLTD